jgi:hypothetical protein
LEESEELPGEPVGVVQRKAVDAESTQRFDYGRGPIRECASLADGMRARFAKQGVGEHLGRLASTAFCQPRYERPGQEYQPADAKYESRAVR